MGSEMCIRDRIAVGRSCSLTASGRIRACDVCPARDRCLRPFFRLARSGERSRGTRGCSSGGHGSPRAVIPPSSAPHHHLRPRPLHRSWSHPCAPSLVSSLGLRVARSGVRRHQAHATDARLGRRNTRSPRRPCLAREDAHEIRNSCDRAPRIAVDTRCRRRHGTPARTSTGAYTRREDARRHSPAMGRSSTQTRRGCCRDHRISLRVG